MDRTFNVIMAQGAAGPLAGGPFNLGRSDAELDKKLVLDIAAMGTSAVVFAGRLSTTDCQNVLANTGTNVGEVVAVVAAGGRVEAAIEEDVRALTVYLLANAPATPAGVTVRVKSE